MPPLAHEPSIRLLILELEARASLIEKLSRPISRGNGNRFPARIVLIGGESIDAEWIRRDVELQRAAVEVHARAGGGLGVDKHGVRGAGAGVVGFYFGGVSWVGRGGEGGRTYKPSLRTCMSRR
jgi:hypothetical protein